MNCKARQYSDQLVCRRCGHHWDVNDDDPPKCLTSREIGNKALTQIKQTIKNPPK